MSSVLAEFRRRRELLRDLRFDEAGTRITGFLTWAEGNPDVAQVLSQLRTSIDAPAILHGGTRHRPPRASTPEEVASVGLELMRRVSEGEDLWRQSPAYGIEPPYSTTKVQDLANEVLRRFIDPALDHIEYSLATAADEFGTVGTPSREVFFPDQSQHDAYVEIRRILQSATRSISLVDPYVDQSILTLLSTCAKPGLTVRLLSFKLPLDFQLEAIKWLTQHTDIKLEVRTTKEFHDRFIVLDASACWHIGCSIKDAGSKAFMLSQVEDDENRLALLTQINKSWVAGNATIPAKP